MRDVARTVYPADANSAKACLNTCYQTQGQIWALTIANQTIKTVFTPEQSLRLVEEEAISLDDESEDLAACDCRDLSTSSLPRFTL